MCYTGVDDVAGGVSEA